MGIRFNRVWLMGHPILTALGLVLMAGCAPSGPQALRQGGQLIREGKYQEAVSKLDRAVQLLPENAQAWNHLGMAYQGAQQPDLAAQAYLQALKLDRQLAAARYNLGCLRLAQNHPAEAVAELTTFTLMQPESAEGWLQLGLAQLQLRQWTIASQSLERALKLRGNQPEAWNGLGMVNVQKGQYRDALNCFATALRYQSNYGPALLNEAVLYQQVFKNRALALQKYREYLALRPAPPQAAAVERLVAKLDPPAATHLAITTNLPPPPALTSRLPAEPQALSTNIPSVSSGAISQLAVASGPTSSIPIAEATAPPQVNDKSLTNKIVTKSIRLASRIPVTNETTTTAAPPTSANVRENTFVNPAQRETKPAVAPPGKSAPSAIINAMNPVVAIPPAQTNGRASRSNPEMAQGQPALTEVVQLPEADAYLPAKEVVVSGPRLTNAAMAAAPDTSLRSAAVYLPPGSSAQEYGGITNKPSSKAAGWQRLNPLNWGRSKAEEAPIVTPLSNLTNQAKPVRRVAEPAAERLLDTPTKTLTLARTTPLPATAVQPVEKPAVLRYPYRAATVPAAGNRQAAATYFNRGWEAHNAGSNTAALVSFQKAAELDPSWFEAHYNSALMASQTGDLARALREYELALTIDAESVGARYDFALALAKANYPRDAAQQLQLLVTRNLADARVHLLLGNLYAQQLYEPQKARQHYWKVLEMDPRNPQAPAIRSWLASHP